MKQKRAHGQLLKGSKQSSTDLHEYFHRRVDLNTQKKEYSHCYNLKSL